MAKQNYRQAKRQKEEKRKTRQMEKQLRRSGRTETVEGAVAPESGPASNDVAAPTAESET